MRGADGGARILDDAWGKGTAGTRGVCGAAGDARILDGAWGKGTAGSRGVCGAAGDARILDDARGAAGSREARGAAEVDTAHPPPDAAASQKRRINTSAWQGEPATQ